MLQTQCTTPDCGKKVFARGICQGCYYRQRRNGTVARKNLVRSANCTHEGCDKPVLGRNLCTYHYKQTQHPMSAAWRLLRSRNKGAYPSAWDRFDAFLSDVGERPSPRHQLRRIDANMPFSKENVGWRGPVGKNGSGYTKEQQAAYFRNWHLQGKYGIDRVEYERMLEAQGGVCAICGELERAVDKKIGTTRALAVDHDHATGRVRGLLCRDCNVGLGLLDDSVATIRSAVAYLEAHAPKVCEEAAPER